VGGAQLFVLFDAAGAASKQGAELFPSHAVNVEARPSHPVPVPRFGGRSIGGH
jgi:hypothetical protein